MIPARIEAEELLKDAEACNPGQWADHSRAVAMCAERIADSCGDMDPEKAYVLGLLHDIGRKFGVKRRYGAYPQDKWDKNLELKAYFEQKMQQDIYKVVGR